MWQVTNDTLSHCYTKKTKNSKNLKIVKFFDEQIFLELWHWNYVTLHCVMYWLTFKRRMKARYGHILVKYIWNVFTQLLHLMVSGWQVTASSRLWCVLMTRKYWTFFCASALLTNHKKTRFEATIFPSTLL
jgi:hypothetical protein